MSRHAAPFRIESLDRRILMAATPVLVKETSIGTRNSDPHDYEDVGGTVFFVASDDPYAHDDLWKTDGTAAGTVRVKDFGPRGGPGQEQIGDLTAVGGRLFFSAPDVGGGNQELWTSDGTEAGTFRVKDVVPGPDGSDPFELVNFNGKLYFSAYTPDRGRELWTSDGTEAGTFRVRDINPGPNGSDPRAFVKLNGKLYFSAGDETHGYWELWATDGTEAGTELVAELTPGTQGARFLETRAAGSQLFMVVEASGRNFELWKSDGTSAGTALLKTFSGGGTAAHPHGLFDFHGTLYFTGAGGAGLWKSDGTAGGTVLLKDIVVGPGSSDVLDPPVFAELNGSLYFAAHEPGNNEDFELWTSDGTEAGTVPAVDVRPGPGGSTPTSLTTVGDAIFFAADGGPGGAGRELWKSDGTPAGTALVADIRPGFFGSNPNRFLVANNRLFFTASKTELDAEPWTTDGTAAGTVQLADINPAPRILRPLDLVASGGTVFFTVGDDPALHQLWKTDGTAAGTTRVSDALVATFPAPVDVGGTLFFAGYDPARGWAVWKTDGTDAGTVKVKDVIPGPIDDRPTRLFDFNGALLFGDGAGLWKSDGTEAGTVLLSAAYSGSPIVVSGGVGYFAGLDGPATASLWRTDGTPAGTFRVGGPAPAELTDVNGTLFFKGTDSVAGAELWKSDGTPAGTVLVKDILPSGSSDPIRLTAFGDQLMFFARSAPTFPSAYRLWRSDGTAAGTVEVGHDITFPGGTAVLGDTFYFGASYAGGALGLFKSDGRTTTFVKPFDFDAPAQLVAANGKLYFVGNTRATGTELWASDGTPAGTVVVADLAPGPDGSRPSPLRLVGRTLYFGTDAGLWKLDVGAPHEVVGRHVFYNHSSFDGNNAAATAADDGAIATDKAALLPGRAATFANVTSYDKGINGVMVDITALPQNATLTPADFEVAGGTPPLTVSVRRGAGVDGSDRVTLTWPDYNPLTDPPTMALANGWLTVTVKANANTGLAAPDVFSFGNLIGETGDGTGASGWRVGAVDLGALKHTLNALRSITSKTDVNRDGSVNVLDLAVLKRNLNHALPPPGVVAAAATPRAPSVPLPLAVAASAQRARRIAEGLLA